MNSTKILCVITNQIKLTSRRIHNGQHNFADNKYTLNQIRDQFRSFTGGKIDLRKDDTSGIAFMTIDHCEKRNGLSGKMMVDLNDAIGSLESWKTGKGLILHGSGGTFCSGGYLETVKQIANPQDGYKMATLMHNSVLRLRNLRLVSVSLVDGNAVGGGAELCLATDFRLMSPTSQIRFVEARMGVGTGWGGGKLLRELVGHRTALDLLLTCRRISADEAIVIGLADDIMENNNGQNESFLNSAVHWLNQRIGEHGHSVVQTVKGIIVADDFEKEKEIFAETWGGEAQQNALLKNIKHK